MRILLIIQALFFSFPLLSQVDTFTTSLDTFDLEIEILGDTLDEEFSDFVEMPDSIIVQDYDDFETAFSKYGQQIEWDSTSSNAYFKRAELLVGTNDVERYGKVKCDEDIYQQAKADFDKAIELRPHNRNYYFQRGEFHYNFLRYEEARIDFNEAFNRSYGNDLKMRALAQRSITNCRLGRSEPCIRDLETALKQDPFNLDLLKARSFSHMILKEHSLVIDHLNRILQLDSDNHFAHSNMAFTAIGLEKYEKAIAIYEGMMAKYGEDPLSIGNIGFAKMKLGRYEEALENINQSLKIFPNNSFAIKNRALIYFELKNTKLACEDLERAKDLGYTVEYGNDLIELLFEKCLEVNLKPKNNRN